MMRFLSIASSIALSLLAIGCGAKPIQVNGVVLLDGKPVEDATVTFVTADGKVSANGYTDASGNFSLSTTADAPGAFPGEYKVVVVKTPKGPVVTNTDPTSSEYMKHMKKEAAEQSKGTAPGDMMKMKAMSKGGAPAGPPGGGPGGGSPVKSELPSMYASVATTPLTSKVPPDSQPVKIELKSK